MAVKSGIEWNNIIKESFVLIVFSCVSHFKFKFLRTFENIRVLVKTIVYTTAITALVVIKFESTSVCALLLLLMLLLELRCLLQLLKISVLILIL